MKYKQNLHTHSTYCDGKDTPREMIEAAIKKGFDSIGFSGHSYMSYSPVTAMRPDTTPKYINEINALKNEYKGKIDIYCGIEHDMYSGTDLSLFDYSLGAVHYLLIGNEYVGFDRSVEVVDGVINKYFGGNGMAYAKKYYEELSKLPQYGKVDIIAHFDLVNKHLESRNYFDAGSDEYISYAVAAAKKLRNHIELFEVNTGAIARGYRTSPYPTVPILKELKALGFSAIISSDCHNSDMLDCHFAESEALLKECGFNEIIVLKEKGFEPISI